MACGCVGTCNCNIVGVDGVTVQYVGDKIVISGTQSAGVPTFVQSTIPAYDAGPYVWYRTDPDTGEVLEVLVETEGAP